MRSACIVMQLKSSEQLVRHRQSLRLLRIMYELTQCAEQEPELCLYRIEWDSLDGHNKGFHRSSEFSFLQVYTITFFFNRQETHRYGSKDKENLLMNINIPKIAAIVTIML